MQHRVNRPGDDPEDQVANAERDHVTSAVVAIEDARGRDAVGDARVQVGPRADHDPAEPAMYRTGDDPHHARWLLPTAAKNVEYNKTIATASSA